MTLRLSTRRFFLRDATAKGLCIFAVMLWAVWGVMFAVLDRGLNSNRTGLAVLFVFLALLTAIFAVILRLKMLRLRAMASSGQRVAGRVTHCDPGTSKTSGYMMVEYTVEGRVHRFKHVTISPPRQQFGDEFELLVDSKTPERAVPHHLFEEAV